MKSTIILNIAATAFMTCFAGTQFVSAETLKISTFVPPKHALIECSLPGEKNSRLKATVN